MTEEEKIYSKSVFRNNEGCYQNRNPSQDFSRDNVISKVLKISFSGGVTF